MPRRPLPAGGMDDPVADWGPDAGHGLFDPSESTASGDVTGHEVTASRSNGGEAERPVAVLAWIGATLTVARGMARGDVPALRTLVDNEPLDLLPGGFFPLTGMAWGDEGRSESTSPPQPPVAPAPPPAVEPAPRVIPVPDIVPDPDPVPVYEPPGLVYSRSPPEPEDEVAPPPEVPTPGWALWQDLGLVVLIIGLLALSLRACS